jgi:hypothetical protein
MFVCGLHTTYIDLVCREDVLVGNAVHADVIERVPERLAVVRLRCASGKDAGSRPLTGGNSISSCQLFTILSHGRYWYRVSCCGQVILAWGAQE